MQQRSVGATGLTVSRLGLGTMTWGGDTDEHEARDQLIAFAEAGGTLRRHRRRLRRRRVRGADRPADRRRRRPRRDRARDQGGIARRSGERETDTSRGHLLADLDASLQRLGRRPRRPLAGAHLGRRRPDRGDAHRRWTTRSRPAGRRTSASRNYTGWQTAQAATWQRAVPGRAPLASTQVEYSLLNRGIEHEVVPAAAALGLGILPWSPLGRGVLTGKYRTGIPVGLPRRLGRTSPASSSATSTTARQADRRGRRQGRRRPRLVADSRWRWPGSATGPASPPRSSAPAPPRSCAAPSASRS